MLNNQNNHTNIKIGNFSMGNNLPFVLIAGPCQTESLEHSLLMATSIADICKSLGINFIYKSSFDKANRSSINGKRGLGLEKTLSIFAKVKETYLVETARPKLTVGQRLSKSGLDDYLAVYLENRFCPVVHGVQPSQQAIITPIKPCQRSLSTPARWQSTAN